MEEKEKGGFGVSSGKMRIYPCWYPCAGKGKHEGAGLMGREGVYPEGDELLLVCPALASLVGEMDTFLPAASTVLKNFGF